MVQDDDLDLAYTNLMTSHDQQELYHYVIRTNMGLFNHLRQRSARQLSHVSLVLVTLSPAVRAKYLQVGRLI